MHVTSNTARASMLVHECSEVPVTDVISANIDTDRDSDAKTFGAREEQTVLSVVYSVSLEHTSH